MSPPWSLQASLARKLSALLADVQSVPKAHRNKDQNYDYASAEDLVAQVRPLLAKHGLALLADVEEVVREVSTYKKSNGADGFQRTSSVRVAYTLLDSDTGYGLTRRFEGDGIDYGDKATAKAMTAATKTMLRTLFLVDLGDDAERDSIEAGRPVDRTRSGGSSGRPQSRTSSIPTPPPSRPSNGDGPDTVPIRPTPTVEGQIERTKRLKDKGDALGVPKPQLKQGMTAETMRDLVDAYEQAIREAEGSIPVPAK